MSKRNYIALWDCTYCGTKKIFGVDPKTERQIKYCPNCGAPVPAPILGKGVEGNPYYIPLDEEKIQLLSAHSKKLANSGKNWTCSSCGSSMSQLNNNCTSCGCGKNGETPGNLIPKNLPREKVK